MLRRILSRDGAAPKVSGYFYKAVVQSILLYGCETWVLTEAMYKLLEAFHHGVARQLTGHRARCCRVTRVWSALPIAEVLEQASFFTIREYISRRQEPAIEYIATRPIYQSARATQRRSGSSVKRKRYWTQFEDDNH